MPKSRLPLILGVGAVSGVGYYLYLAGGNTKAAENKFESDLHKTSASVKDHLPGRSPVDAGKDLKGYGQEAGEKVDKALAEADKQYSKAKSNAEAFAKEARAETLKTVDKFDKSVEEGAAKAKGGISSWFSSGNK